MIINLLLSLLCHFFFVCHIYSLFIFQSIFSVATALRDVEVFVPSAVRRGETARLHCMYDLEGDTLYAVKWYKGRREFYR